MTCIVKRLRSNYYGVPAISGIEGGFKEAPRLRQAQTDPTIETNFCHLQRA